MNTLNKPSFLIPDWPVQTSVGAAFSLRTGGVSTAPWDSLNLGTHVNDQLENVMANRQSIVQALGVQAVYLTQVHGNNVVELNKSLPSYADADGVITSEQGLACAMMVADCLPVLFASADCRVVGAAHAGWRGLALGVLEATVARMRERQNENTIYAWLGPCIGPEAFEVGAEVYTAFTSHQSETALQQISACFVKKENGKYLADLARLARLRLQAVAVHNLYGNDSSSVWCTVSHPERYFSHRRDAAKWGNTGRMAAYIWRK